MFFPASTHKACGGTSDVKTRMLAASAVERPATLAMVPGEIPADTATPQVRLPLCGPWTALCTFEPSVLPDVPRTARCSLAPRVSTVEDTAAVALTVPDTAVDPLPVAAPNEGGSQASDVVSGASSVVSEGRGRRRGLLLKCGCPRLAAAAFDNSDVPNSFRSGRGYVTSYTSPQCGRGRCSSARRKCLAFPRTFTTTTAASGCRRAHTPSHAIGVAAAAAATAIPAAAASAHPVPLEPPALSDNSNTPSSAAAVQVTPQVSDAVPAPPAVEPMIIAAAEAKFRDAVSDFSRSDWAREQELEFE